MKGRLARAARLVPWRSTHICIMSWTLRSLVRSQCRSAGRYADNIAHLTVDVSEGSRARERSAECLKANGLTLKGPGKPADLRSGGTVDLLNNSSTPSERCYAAVA